MKKIVLALCFVLCTTFSYADFTVIYDKNSSEVFYMGYTPDDFRTDDNSKYTSVIFQGELDDYPLEYPIEYYKISGKKLVVNTNKISTEENKKAEDIAKAQKKETDFQSAKEKLIGLGLTESECESLR